MIHVLAHDNRSVAAFGALGGAPAGDAARDAFADRSAASARRRLLLTHGDGELFVRVEAAHGADGNASEARFELWLEDNSAVGRRGAAGYRAPVFAAALAVGALVLALAVCRRRRAPPGPDDAADAALVPMRA